MAHFLFISTMGSVAWGGSEELWAGAALRILEAGHKVTAHVFHWDHEAPQVAELERKGVTVIRRPRWLPKPARLAYELIGLPTSERPFTWRVRLSPDLVVISQGHALDGVALMQECRRRGWRYAAIAQANGEALWPNDSEAEDAAMGYRGASKAYFVSRSNLSMLGDQLGGDIANAEVVSNPFKVPFSPVVPPPLKLDALRLACVARLDPISKGQDVLLRVLSQDRWRKRPIEVRFYGEGRCEVTLKRLVAHLDLKNVFFEGHVNDVQRIWAENHALILPSRLEGTPLALIEAMLCSRTAIVTDVGGNADLVEDGVSGFIAKAPTRALLDDAMERAWSARAQIYDLGRAARKGIVERIPGDPLGDFAVKLLGLV